MLEISLFKYSIDPIFINSYLTNAITILLVTSILLGTSSHFFSITDLVFPIFLHLLNKTYKIHFPPKKINSKSSFQFFIVFSLLLHNLHTIHPFFHNIDCLLVHYIYLSPDNCYFTIFLEIFTSFVIIFFFKIVFNQIALLFLFNSLLLPFHLFQVLCSFLQFLFSLSALLFK